jgi:integrase
MTVCTWLKKNTVVSITGLLRAEDWLEKKDTEPNPYTEGELKKLFAAAGEHRLLLRVFLGTGMREQEVAHAEYEDINFAKGFIQVQEKPQWGWKPKIDAGTRKIPLGDSLLTDLSFKGPGLLFPNKNTKRPEGHFLRIIKGIAERAGVTGAGCHRWRDTFATDQIRAKVLDLRDIAKIMGHENMEMMKLYAAFVDLESQEARSAANASDRFGAARGPKVVAIAS